MRRAVITGATGAIGTALTELLLQNGVQVLVLCRRGGRVGRIPRHPLLSLKFCALDELAHLKNDTDGVFDVFYHLAWSGTTGAARDHTRVQVDNVRYALDAVEAAKRLGCHSFIGVGSQAEYGRVKGLLRPDTPTFPESGYGIAKLAAGQLTRIAAEQRDFCHTWVRVVSVYGPNDSEGSLIASTIQKLLTGKRPQFTAATQLWDFLYSEDAARALYLLGTHARHGAVYVLGSGAARPLKDYILTLRDIAAPHASLQFGELPFAPRQIMHLCADITALTRDTGWVPTTSFAEGIQKTVQHTRDLLELPQKNFF